VGGGGLLVTLEGVGGKIAVSIKRDQRERGVRMTKHLRETVLKKGGVCGKEKPLSAFEEEEKRLKGKKKKAKSWRLKKPGKPAVCVQWKKKKQDKETSCGRQGKTK